MPQSTEDVQEIVRICAAAPGADRTVRPGLIARGAGQRPAGRRVDRLPRHEQGAGGPRRGPGLRDRARHHPQGAQRVPARPGRVLSDRSRRRRLARRHGGDALFGHQRGALWHHEGQCAGAQSGDAVGRGDEHGAPRQEILRRLRSHAADGRLGGDARRHHRADAQALRHSRGDRGRHLSIPVG